MKPAGNNNALRRRSLLSSPNLWVTAILHAVLIGILLLWNQWALREWPVGSWEQSYIYYFMEAVLVFDYQWAFVIGVLIWLADVAAYLLIRTRWGLGKSLAFATTMTGIWMLLLIANLAWTTTRVEKFISRLKDITF
ncbi:MAG: hypothetical protein ABMA26_05095 [Limisphaerales bacterium]